MIELIVLTERVVDGRRLAGYAANIIFSEWRVLIELWVVPLILSMKRLVI